MDFIDEISPAIGQGLREFQAFIEKKMKANKDYLDRLYWLSKGAQKTVLNYLIELHQEPSGEENSQNATQNLTQFIAYILNQSKDVNLGEPLHQSIVAGKIQLAFDMLQSHSEKFDVDRRNEDGHTLLSLILDTKNTELLSKVLAQNPNLHASTNRTQTKVQFQPIHQAVVLDFAEGVLLLAKEDADLSNPFGVMRDTPLSLAARLGKINALEALLELPLDRLAPESENKHLFDDQSGYTAIDELCERIDNNTGKKDAIRGVAMMLCRGAEPPRNDSMRTLLSNHRSELLKAVQDYLETRPELVDAFVARCHLAESALHNIFYANRSWGSSLRHLFGKPSDTAFLIEDLVVRKHFNPKDGGTLSTLPAESFVAEKDPRKLYAAFVKLYNQAYDSQLITNPWSTMRWMIAEGRCDWDTVLRYSENNPTSRTRIIIHEMFHQVPTGPTDTEEQVPTSPLCTP